MNATTGTPPKGSKTISEDAVRSGAGASDPSPNEKSQKISWYFAGRNLALNLAAAFVQRLLFQDSVSVVFGESTAGKSFWLLDLAFHVAMGWVWRGRQVRRGAVIYICLEGESGFRKRIVGYCQRHGIKDEQVPIVVRCVPLELLRKGPDEIIRWVREEIEPAVRKLWGIPVNWIIVDTLSQEMAGLPEDNETFSLLVSYGRRIASELCVEATFVHHPGKNFENGARGGYSLKANINTEIEIRKQDGHSIAKVTKVKDGQDGEEFPFRLEEVDLGLHDQWMENVTTCVVAQLWPADLPDSKTKAPTGQAADALRILNRTLDESGIYRAGSELNDAKLPADRKILREEDWWQACLDGGFAAGAKDRDNKRRAFIRALASLRDAGIIAYWKDFVWIE